MKLYSELESYINSLAEVQLNVDRKEILDALYDYLNNKENPKLNFICTHNSRRSHMSQLWSYALSNHFDFKVEVFSGGTAVTAFHPNAVAALSRAGFKIESPGGENPKHKVQISDSIDSLTSFSKEFDSEENPKKDFAAIMTCSQAEAECPIVFGADMRIKLFYEDPKVADGTAEESRVYDERCFQIASELYYVFNKLK